MKYPFRLVVLWSFLFVQVNAQETPALPDQIVAAARNQVGVTTGYDPAYVTLKYPGGDVPLQTGVCSDVVIRALRATGLDLQKAVHEDMVSAFAVYPKKWVLKKPDRNIDHRRVPNLMCFFERKHLRLTEKLTVASAYAPGDIVVWDLGSGVLHIGIVSDKKTKDVPLVIHNVGNGTKEEDLLFGYRVVGHYRIKPAA